MGDNKGANSQPNDGRTTWNGGKVLDNYSPDAFNSQFLQNIYKVQQQGPDNPYNKSLYTGMGWRTKNALNDMSRTAKQGQAGLNNAYQTNQQTINQNGLTNGQRGDIRGLNQISNRYNRAYKDAGQTSLYEKTMLGTAQGDNLGDNNPYLNDMISQTNENMGANINAQFGNSGRFGSSAQVQTLGRQLGQNELNMRYGDYNNSLDRQQQALQGIEGYRQQGVSNRSNALQGMQGVAGQQFGMRQTGQANLANALGMNQGLYDATLDPSRTNLQVGQVFDQNRNLKRQADFEQYNRNSNQDLNWLKQISGLTGGVNQGYEQSTPWWMNALGIGTSIAGAFI